MSDPGFLKRMAAVSGMVLEMAALAIAGGIAGSWLDTRLGTGPLFLLLLLFGGMGAGMARMLYTVKRLSDDEPHDDPNRRP